MRLLGCKKRPRGEGLDRGAIGRARAGGRKRARRAITLPRHCGARAAAGSPLGRQESEAPEPKKKPRGRSLGKPRRGADRRGWVGRTRRPNFEHDQGRLFHRAKKNSPARSATEAPVAREAIAKSAPPLQGGRPYAEARPRSLEALRVRRRRWFISRRATLDRQLRQIFLACL